jgi:hypothetical protein
MTDGDGLEIKFRAQGVDDHHEFVELHNREAIDVDISGWSFSDGIVSRRLSDIHTAGDFVMLTRTVADAGVHIPSGIDDTGW